MISPPETGQLVEVRRRQWVVADIDASGLNGGPPQHLVTLSSIDEDATDEEIQVVWELEAGARILEKAGLPSLKGYDDPERLEAFLDAVRWGAATNADRNFLQAPFRSGITIDDFQLDPLVRSLDMARVNLLIADDVGLGKTIEAGLVIQEMLVRHRARTVLIVCPASLQIKWQTEMHEKFGLEFRIVDTDYVKRLRRERGIHANPWTSYPRLITSMDWAKAGEPLRSLKDALPPHVTYPRKLDILVVDEVHNFAPAMATNYALESQRTRLIRTIVPHFEHRLFLSATPHNGYLESFTSLLELLDDQRFARNVEPDEKHLQRVMVRRLKEDLVDEMGTRIFAKRVIQPLEIDYSDEEREIHRLLRAYTKNRRTSFEGSRFKAGADFILNLLKKRLFSSPRAFAITLAKHREALAGKRPKKSDSALDERILLKAIAKAEEDYADDSRLEEAIDDAVTEVATISADLSKEESELLDRLSGWAEKARNRPDAKADAIISWLNDHLRPGGKWNGERVILFTEYLATHGWLHEILSSHGFGGDRLMVMHGGLDSKERDRVMAAFQASPEISPVRVLLATDAASEGIDLQNHCCYLIHVEIPWNPNVMEQRNGRIDRHGQRRPEVHIWHPVGKGFKPSAKDSEVKVGDLEGDHEYLMRAVIKVEAIRRDLGSVGPVIARNIQEAMSGDRNDNDTKAAEVKAEKARKYVAAERQLQEKIARLHDRLQEARKEFHLAPERIAKAVETGLELAERPPLVPATLPGATKGPVFDVPLFAGSWGRDTAGLNHPHTGTRRPITFDHAVSKGRDDVVLAHLNHRLVQRCLRLLRAEIWALEEEKSLHRVAVRLTGDPTLEVPVVALWSRLVVTGGNHQRLHEELTLSGGELKPSGFARISQVGRLQELLEGSSPVEPDPAVWQTIAETYDRAADAILATVEARSRDRLKNLESTLERRKKGDIAHMEKLLTELEGLIKRAIADTQAIQLEFWESEKEKMQVRRDVDALGARLKRIPEERVQEVASIEKRYSGLAQRTFPVAAILILPEKLAGRRTHA
jgi:superfamily II DNA or RNA helicase